MDLIISHGHCPDGFVAAYIAKKRYPEAEVVFLDHGLTNEQSDQLVNRVFDKDVLMLDYSLRTRFDNDMLVKAAKSFRILDHHKSAKEVLEGAPYAIFDMTRSGAGLAWDYLFGEDNPDSIGINLCTGKRGLARPWYVDYIEDRDLWNWKLTESRAVNAYLGTLPLTFEEWDKLPEAGGSASAAELGKGALAHINHYVREAVTQAQKGRLAGYDINILNVVYLNCSEVGNELAKTADFSVTWFERGDGMIQFSLRSIGDKDVSRIAKRFNGGGHKNAAGFQMSLYEGRKLIDAILSRKVDNVSMSETRSSGGCV